MKMKTLVAIFALVLCLPMITKAQTSYSGQFEVGYQHYLFRTITVDALPSISAKFKLL
jgi:hypothetical protein